MIKLRLKRFGKKREASFRLVACNSTSRRDGRPLQELGYYNPALRRPVWMLRPCVSVSAREHSPPMWCAPCSRRVV